MLIVVTVFAALAGLLHVVIFAMESLLFMKPQVHRDRFGVADPKDAQVIRPWAFNQGFYNLFLGIGAIVGAVMIHCDPPTTGWTLIVFACGSMLAAAIVLVSGDRNYLKAAATQGLFPAIALIATLINCLWTVN